jgi:hypothetical protein
MAATAIGKTARLTRLGTLIVNERNDIGHLSLAIPGIPDRRALDRPIPLFVSLEGI